jgi:hypothetical protein
VKLTDKWYAYKREQTGWSAGRSAGFQNGVVFSKRYFYSLALFVNRPLTPTLSPEGAREQEPRAHGSLLN